MYRDESEYNYHLTGSHPEGNVAVLSPLIKNHKGTVFVQGRFANSQTKQLFETYGYKPVDRLQDADIVCWTGGEDINPEIYKEKPAGAVHWDVKRDTQDLAAIYDAKDKFKVGICRGAQLLNCIPNGGTLWQDIDNHWDGSHAIYDNITQETVVVNSLHHQGIRLTDKAELVAFANLSNEKYCYATTWNRQVDDPDPDVEVAYYPETRSLLIQSHPEFEREGATGKYFSRLMQRYYDAA